MRLEANPSEGAANQRIAIATGNIASELLDEVAGAVEVELRDLGFSTVIVRDGDEVGLECSTILFITDPKRYPLYARKLMAMKKRPRTVVWLIGPLAPAEPGGVWREEGLALAQRHETRMGYCGVLGWPIVPYRRRMRNAERFCRWLARGSWDELASRYAAATGMAGGEVDGGVLRIVFHRSHYLEKALGDGWIDRLAVSTMGKHDLLASMGIESVFAPVGVHAKSGKRLGGERDIDVLFLGNTQPGRRRTLLDQLQKGLADAGVELKVVNRACWDDERTALLNRTKLILHLHQIHWDTPWIRLMMGAACGAMMVTEPFVDPRPFEPGTHFVESSAEELLGTIKHYLAHEDERAAVVDQAEALVRERLTLRTSLRKMLGMIED